MAIVVIIQGSLLKAMQSVSASLAVIAIDEFYRDDVGIYRSERFNHYLVADTTAAQQKVIMLTQSYYCQVFFVQMDKSISESSYYYSDESRLSRCVLATNTSCAF